MASWRDKYPTYNSYKSAMRTKRTMKEMGTFVGIMAGIFLIFAYIAFTVTKYFFLLVEWLVKLVRSKTSPKS